MSNKPETCPVSASPESRDDCVCRLCWGEAEDSLDGQLISPCGCTGSVKYIHRRCLYDWQRTLRSQGLESRSRVCELCKKPYRDLAGPLQRQLHQRLLDIANAASQRLLEQLRCPSWPEAFWRLWREYVYVNGVITSVRMGLAGLKLGVRVGTSLVYEQTQLLESIITSMSSLLGSPYAELLCCQAVGALLVGMLSELVYTSLIGLVAGAVYGFAYGCVNAIKSSSQLVVWSSVLLLRPVASVAACVWQQGARLVAASGTKLVVGGSVRMLRPVKWLGAGFWRKASRLLP